MPPNGLCATCEAMPASRRGECGTCSRYRYRTGKQRPERFAERQPDLNYKRIVGG